MSNAPYGYQPHQSYPPQGDPYGQPSASAPGQGYGQPQNPPTGAGQGGSLFEPGDEQAYPFGLPPEVVAQRRAARQSAAQQPSASQAPYGQPSASQPPYGQPSASQPPYGQPSASSLPPESAPAPQQEPAAANPYAPYAPQPPAAPNPYAPPPAAAPDAPQQTGAPNPYAPQADAVPSPYAPRSEQSGQSEDPQGPYTPQAYPTYSSAQEPVPSAAQAGHTNLQQRADERPAADGWFIEFDDGREVEIHGVALIGRNPQPRAGEQAQLVTVGDEARKISKTHFAIGVDQRGIYLCDRGSTNGTAIENAPDDFRPCPEGELVRLQEGQKISFGDHSLHIRRQA